MVRMILCCDYQGNIGRNNALLFKMKEDMKFFRESTTGHVIVMGYNTWLSLGEKSLPNRTNIVLYDEISNICLSPVQNPFKNDFIPKKICDRNAYKNLINVSILYSSLISL